MRGISAIIAIILILMIVVAIAALSYTFFMGIFTSTTETAEESITKTTTGMLANMKIESASNSNIYVRNTGQTDISDLSVYVDDEPVEVTMDPPTIEPGDVGTVSVKEYIGKENVNVKITTAQGSVTITEELEEMTFCDDPNVVLCLTFDEGTGTTAYDSSPYGNDGTLWDANLTDGENIPPEWVDGKYGKALKFVNISGYEYQLLNISHSETLNISSKNFTILTWVKPEIGSNFLVFLKHPPDLNRYWALYRDSGSLRFDLIDPIVADLTLWYNSFPDNNLWQHIAVTKESTTVKLYNNGSKVEEGSFTGNENAIGTMWIGGDLTPLYVNYFSNCIIDELIILNKSLTAAEILEEFEK